MHKGNSRPVILVVEDIDWIRAGMVSRLKEYGYEVAEATDASEAVSMAERVSPALILTEEELPTYEDLLKRRGEHPSLGRVPVAIINPDAEECTRYGESILLSSYESIEHLLAKQPT